MSDDLSDPPGSGVMVLIGDVADGNVAIGMRTFGIAPGAAPTRAQKIAARMVALLNQAMAREAKFHDGKPGSMAHIDEVAGPLAPPRPPVQPQRRASRRMRRGQ